MKNCILGIRFPKTIDSAHVFETHKKPHRQVGRKTYFEILWSKPIVGTAPAR